MESRLPIQLKMNFSGENPLAVNLRTGRFVILIEQNSPPREQPFESAMTPAVTIAKRLAACDEVVGMALTDRLRTEDAHDPVDAAALLAEAGGKPCLMTLSGKGSSRERIRDCLARAASKGIRNVLAVTGDRSDRHALKRSPIGRIAPYPAGYLDSVEALRLIRGSTTGLYAGAGVNPFKYNAPDQFLQYYKMLRKLNTGAEFIVAHAGWDMKKLQELQWFLQMREMSYPVLARVRLLSPEDIAVIHNDPCPGVQTARLFYAMLQRESSLNPAQCMAAQLHRIGLQVAGCKFLGYSGVQLVGLRDLKSAEMVLARIREALEQFKSYPDWITAWNDFHNFSEFAPRPAPFYAFEKLLTREHQYYDAATCTLTTQSWPSPRSGDRWRALWLKWFLAPSMPKSVSSSAMFFGCRGCRRDNCQFRHCYYLCPRDCPKGLVFGPCGGSSPDGTCEFGHAPCFFHRVLAVAAARQEMDHLEEGIPPGD